MAVKKIKPIVLIEKYKNVLWVYYRNFKNSPHFVSHINAEIKSYGINKKNPKEVIAIWEFTGFVDMLLHEPKQESSVFRFTLKNGNQVDMKIGKSKMRIIPRGEKFFAEFWDVKNVNVFIPRDENYVENLKSMIDIFGPFYRNEFGSDYVIVTYNNIVMRDSRLIVYILESINNVK